MGKYNKLTKKTNYGAGLMTTLGPLHGGVSTYDDETELDPDNELGDITTSFKYRVLTTNIGISLGSVLIDQSHLKITVPDYDEEWSVDLLTVSLLVKKLILTLSKRIEESSRYKYNYETKQLENITKKEDTFVGIQINASKNIMFGVYHNYYLLQETSFSTTFFF